MKKQYKALILDIDGTIIPRRKRKDKRISPRVRQAIALAKDRIPIGIATGRSYDDAMHVLRQVSISAPAIILNGSQLVDPRTGNTLFEQPLLQEDTVMIIDILRAFKVDFVINERRKTLTRTKRYIPNDVFTIYATNLPMRLAENIKHVIATKSSTVVTHRVPTDIPEVVHMDISHVYATKQQGIYQLAKMLNLQTADIIGVGDGWNDFPLLMACGFKIAMGNAVSDLKAIADYIAPSVEEDGVADIINTFVLEN